MWMVHYAKNEKRTRLICPQKSLLANMRIIYNSIPDVGKP
jgi:hypothetical protein